MKKSRPIVGETMAVLVEYAESPGQGTTWISVCGQCPDGDGYSDIVLIGEHEIEDNSLIIIRRTTKRAGPGFNYWEVVNEEE